MTFRQLGGRLRFDGGGAGGDEAAPTRALMARTFVYLYGWGGTLALLTLALPHAPDWHPAGIIGPALAAYGVSAVMLIGFDRYPLWVYHALPTFGTVLASIVVLSGGATALAAYAGYYFWVVLSAFFMFSRRWAFFNLVFVGVAYATVLLLSPEANQRMLNWVMGMGALLVGGSLIGLLRDRVERLVEKLSDAYRGTLESEAALAYAQSLARIGSWELDVATGRLHASRALYRIFGFDAQGGPARGEQLADRIHPDDRERVAAAFEEARRGGAAVDLHHRVVWPDGTIRVVHSRGQLTGSRRRAPELVGTIQDVTERTRQEELLRRTLDQLRATNEVALALGRETALPDLLRLIARRSAELVKACSVLIFVVEEDVLSLAAHAGERVVGGRDRLAAGSPEARRLLRAGVRRSGGGTESESLEPLGLPPDPAIVAPLTFRGRAEGLLVALERTEEGPDFHEDDVELMRSFASSAATAVATARSVAQDRLRRTIEAAERERQYWARELHDQTLQGLGALRMRLDLALQGRSAETLEEAARETLAHVSSEIDSLRRMISDLRPALLEEFGLHAAIEALCERTAIGHDLRVLASIDLPAGNRIPGEMELTVFRIVQEALSNVTKHAAAGRAEVDVRVIGEAVRVRIRDDGIGFDPGAATEGFGLSGMNERVALLGGRLWVYSRSGETTVEAALPVERRIVSRRKPPQRNGPGAFAPGPSKAEAGEKGETQAPPA